MSLGSKIASAAIAASGAGPIVLAQVGASTPPPQVNGVTIPVWALSIMIAVGLGVIGYFLRRSLDQVDKTLERLDARVGGVEARLSGVEGKLSVVARERD